MATRPYFSMRSGRRPPTIDLDTARRLFLAVFTDLADRGFFGELTGYDCVDEGTSPGTAGSDIGAFVFRRTFSENLWPVQSRYASWTEAEFMDAIEFLYDHVSKPTEPRYYHSYNNCGYHDSTFDSAAGRERYRSEVNDILALLDGGWELSETGEVVRQVTSEVADLLSRELPDVAGATARERVTDAVRKFRSRTSDKSDRHDAVRDLADVLEFLRPQLKLVLTKKDDALLFDMVNSFGIRHLNEKQHTEYNENIWLSWMFHFLLATIHAGTRFIDESSPARVSDA